MVRYFENEEDCWKKVENYLKKHVKNYLIKKIKIIIPAEYGVHINLFVINEKGEEKEIPFSFSSYRERNSFEAKFIKYIPQEHYKYIALKDMIIEKTNGTCPQTVLTFAGLRS